MAEAFTQEQMTECRDLFDMYDRNEDGMLQPSEFKEMMRSLGLQLTERELDVFLHRMDESGDGNIQFEEMWDFLQMISRPVSVDEEMEEAFRRFTPQSDANSGEISCDCEVITRAGLAEALKVMGEDITETECGEMIRAATGGGEVLDFEVFKKFCMDAGSRGITRFEDIR
mmetsp:Transcript_44561/g.96877  ORF Transcript_44561/g.96877 Transcript_44561/m.96877 type:complete len:171 (+) Transcript_44561:96-608(+)